MSELTPDKFCKSVSVSGHLRRCSAQWASAFSANSRSSRAIFRTSRAYFLRMEDYTLIRQHATDQHIVVIAVDVESDALTLC